MQLLLKVTNSLNNSILICEYDIITTTTIIKKNLIFMYS